MPDERSQLFTLTIDEASKSYLTSVAKWAKFVSITCMVMSGLFFLSAVLSNIIKPDGMESGGYVYRASEITGQILFYIALLGMFFVPNIFSLRFANRMLAALAADDQQLLNSSFRQLKTFLKFVGICLVILIGLCLLAIVVTITDFMH